MKKMWSFTHTTTNASSRCDVSVLFYPLPTRIMEIQDRGEDYKFTNSGSGIHDSNGQCGRG
jgi:hypothetical protein